MPTSNTSAANLTNAVIGATNGTGRTSLTNDYDSPWASLSHFLNHRGEISLALRVLFSSVTIIWLGAHSSLRRPPSAAPPKRKDQTDRGKEKEEHDRFGEGLAASDIIMLPILAGTVLVGLYYLIQWLENPDILNRILRAYLSCFSAVSLSKVLADSLHLLTSIVFPRCWSDRSGKLYKIDSLHRKQVLRQAEDGSRIATSTPANDKTSPFAGPMSGIRFSDQANKFSWELRHLLMEEWTVRVALHGLGETRVGVKLNDVLGALLAIVGSMAYFLTNLTWLSNVLGAAACYTTFSLMSPTSFLIGTGVLVGLFFYDITMVFYT